MINQLSDIKHSHNIVDVIGRYVALKKSGKEYTGLCPFHGEKTPSFSVSEQKQQYFCFGCGAGGDAIKFVMDFSGLSFKEACKELGADVELMPLDAVKRNQEANARIQHWNYPPDHCEERQKAKAFVDSNTPEDKNGLLVYRGMYFAIENCFGDVLNIAKVTDKVEFLAGGVSYSGFTKITKKADSKKYLLVVDLYDAIKISNKHNVNVLICWSDHNMRHIFTKSHGDLIVKPVLSANDDDFLAYETDYFFWDVETLERKECMN